MTQISIKNINQPTSPFWSKMAAACAFVSTSITTTALLNEIHWMGYLGAGLTLVSGLIPIFMNEVKPVQA